MTKYDVLCIFDPATEEASIDGVIKKLEKKVTAAAGNILQVEKKGLQTLASRLKKHKSLKQGIYVNVVVEVPASLPAELDQILRLTEEVVRSMITKKEERPVPAAEAIVPGEEKTEISSSILVEGQKSSG